MFYTYPKNSNELNRLFFFRDEIWDYITNDIIEDIAPNMYMISSYGRVYSEYTKCLMVPYIQSNGYVKYGFSTIFGTRKYTSAHRIVAMKFLPVYNMYELHVNHIDSNKTNNYVGNLEWVTPIENMKHTYDNNLVPIGEDIKIRYF